MRIAHVTSSLSTHGYGVKVVVENLSRETAALGHDVKVFGLSDPLWAKGDNSNWQGAPAQVCSVIGPKSFGYAPTLLKQLLDFEPDLVHVHGLWMYPPMCVLQWHKKTQKPYVLSPHGMLAPIALSYSPLKKAIVSKVFQKKAIIHATALHATCKAEVDEIRAYGYEGKIIEFPNGIEVIDVPDTTKQEFNEIVSIGRLHSVKGLDQLILAWQTLEASHPKWRLRIIGPAAENYDLYLHELINKSGLERISIEGAVDTIERNKILASAELFILPSLNENFAISVAESLLMGTPVISSKGAPWQGLVENDCGWWVDTDVESLSSSLKHAMSIPKSKRSNMGAKGRKWIMHEFNWVNIASKACQEYKNKMLAV